MGWGYSQSREYYKWKYHLESYSKSLNDQRMNYERGGHMEIWKRSNICRKNWWDMVVEVKKEEKAEEVWLPPYRIWAVLKDSQEVIRSWGEKEEFNLEYIQDQFLTRGIGRPVGHPKWNVQHAMRYSTKISKKTSFGFIFCIITNSIYMVFVFQNFHLIHAVSLFHF